jgi:hypothetical protein
MFSTKSFRQTSLALSLLVVASAPAVSWAQTSKDAKRVSELLRVRSRFLATLRWRSDGWWHGLAKLADDEFNQDQSDNSQ